MFKIIEVVIISIDKSDESWAIEGEILFESDLTAAFCVTYLVEDDELEELEIESVPGKYDKLLLKELIKSAAMDYDE